MSSAAASRGAGDDSIAIEPLTYERAERDGEALIGLGADVGWERWSMENLLAERPDKWRFSFVARAGDDPVGYAIASRKGADVHLHHLVVAPRLRGAGLGRQLLARLRTAAESAGAERLTLKVYKDNPAAIRFYEREGFERYEDAGELVAMMTRLRRDADAGQ